jgi:futalosine hydrolase
MTPSLGSPTLLLVPTQLELARLRDLGGFGTGTCILAQCGFGPVAAAARTAQLIGQLSPKRVLLVGIAGAYDTDRHEIGSAMEFGEVALHGVGAGEGADFEGPPSLGFPQWPGSPGTCKHPVVDSLPLSAPNSPELGHLLSTCAASKNNEESARRIGLFPNSIAEDMEGFAVALACALSETPVRIVRGISNQVGNREPGTWRIPAALAAARVMAMEVLEDDSSWA